VGNDPVLVKDRHAELVAAAVTTLRRLGFEQMRLRDVAEEAGVSIGLLQHYFETREQLGREAFVAACGERARRFAESAPQSGSAWSRIERMLRYAFELDGIRDRGATWLDLCAAASRDPRLRREAARVQDVWRKPLRQAIAAGQATGELHPRVAPAAAVEVLLALIDGAELAVTIDTEDERLVDRLLGATLEAVRHLLGVRDSGRGLEQVTGVT